MLHFFLTSEKQMLKQMYKCKLNDYFTTMCIKQVNVKICIFNVHKQKYITFILNCFSKKFIFLN